MELQEKGVTYVQNEQQKHENDVTEVFLMLLLLTLNIVQNFS